ncbi:MAG: biotin/lipoyl-containing protein, partial [Paracoccus sp. (in: a-proteobacteria)]|nr:biotin/lipoyl-containing protein [Paracoccus sp. (in: a-proteobacteria)]
MTTEVRVPALGESVTEATVATWFKKPGDTVAVDEMLCELETDKVTVEVPSPAAGTLAEIIAAEGATVAPDALLAMIGEDGKTAAPAGNDTRKAAGSAAKDEPAAEAPAGKAQEGQKMSGKAVDVMVPSLGESVTEATVATWFKKVGDNVAVDEMLCELETDKVSVEVPSPVAGVLSEIIAEEGATVDAKARLAVIAEGAAGGADAPSAEPKAKDATEVGSPGAGPEELRARDVEDAPSAKKAMAEKNISRDAVQGSGKDGRVMKEDVARAPAAPAPKAAPAAAPADQAGRE